MYNVLCLIEGTRDIEKALKYKKDYEVKFVSFDFLAHKILEKRNIEHVLIEDYLDDVKQKLIDETTKHIVHSWYEDENLSELLIHNDINLGWLLEIEIYSFFLRTVKTIIGIQELIKKDQPDTVIASNFMCSMIRHACDKKINLIEYTNLTKGLTFDVIEISFNLGKRSFSIHISRKFALIIKNLIESVTEHISSRHNDASHNSIILADFNPSLYHNFMNEISKSDMNVFLLNLRKPVGSNMSSWKIVMKNNLTIIYPKQFLNSTSKQTIEENQIKFNHEFTNVLSNNFFNSIFKINDMDVWPVITEYFKTICFNRFSEAIGYIEMINQMLKKLKVKSIVVLNNVGYEEKMLLSMARKHNIELFVLQHGIFPESSYSLNYIDLLPLIPPTGSKAAVWGDSLRKHLIKTGVSPDNIIVVGSPRHDDYFRDGQESRNNGILFCFAPQNEIDFISIDTRNYIKAEQMIKDMFQIVSEKTKNITVKIHPSQYDPLGVKSIVMDIDRNIPVYKNQNIFNFIKNCEVLVCFEFSTVLLEAMILNKPTILYLIHPKWGTEDSIVTSGATILVKTREQFEDALTRLLTDNEFKNNQIKKGRDFVYSYISKQGTSSAFFRDLLEK